MRDMAIVVALVVLGGLIGGGFEHDRMARQYTAIVTGKTTIVQCITVLEKADAAMQGVENVLHDPAREVAEFLELVKAGADGGV